MKTTHNRTEKRDGTGRNGQTRMNQINEWINKSMHLLNEHQIMIGYNFAKI